MDVCIMHMYHVRVTKTESNVLKITRGQLEVKSRKVAIRNLSHTNEGSG